MDQPKTARLGKLNAYQIAGLSIVSSALAAGAVLVLVRRFLLRPIPPDSDRSDPIAGPAMPTETPSHFSENLIVPGMTATGAQISEQDAHRGRSPEGV